MNSRTMFNTPLITPVFTTLSKIILKLLGWKIEGRLPSDPKFVLIAAPHTSTWDGFYMLLVAFAFQVKMRWLGKHTLFKAPFRWLFHWLGGIPVNRTGPRNLVEQAVKLIGDEDRIALAVPPEGTRNHVNTLKTGFYYIALGANVPIVMGFLDYHRKITGVGPVLIPRGNLDEDLAVIQAFYADKTAKYKNKSAFCP